MLYRRQDDLDAAQAASIEAASTDESPSMTIQSAAADTDINQIAKSFGLGARGGMPLPTEALDPSYYGDLRDAPETLQEVMDLALDSERKFAALPVNLRKRFNYSPGALWDFVRDPANAEEAISLGLFQRPPEPPPTEKPPKEGA